MRSTLSNGSGALMLKRRVQWHVIAALALLLASASACTEDDSPSPSALEPPCPTATPLPGGQSVTRDYLDIVRVGDTDFIAEPIFLGAAAADHDAARRDLGPVVTTVRCSGATKSTESVVEMIDRSATVLPVGTQLHSVIGFPATCRLGAIVDSKVRVYWGTDPASSIAAPLPCAIVTP